MKINGIKLADLIGISKSKTLSNVSIANNKIIVNGKEYNFKDYKSDDGNIINIVINEPVNNLDIICSKEISINANVNKLNSTNGDIKITGDVKKVKTTSGDIDISGNVNLGVESISGDITVGGNNTGNIKTISGDIITKNK